MDRHTYKHMLKVLSNKSVNYEGPNKYGCWKGVKERVYCKGERRTRGVLSNMIQKRAWNEYHEMSHIEKKMRISIEVLNAKWLTELAISDLKSNYHSPTNYFQKNIWRTEAKRFFRGYTDLLYRSQIKTKNNKTVFLLFLKFILI